MRYLATSTYQTFVHSFGRNSNISERLGRKGGFPSGSEFSQELGIEISLKKGISMTLVDMLRTHWCKH